MDNSNRTSHCNVGHSIGSSGKTFKKTPGQRNSRTGLQKKLMHQTNPLSHSGVSSTQLSFKPCILRGFQKSLKLNLSKN